MSFSPCGSTALTGNLCGVRSGIFEEEIKLPCFRLLVDIAPHAGALLDERQKSCAHIGVPGESPALQCTFEYRKRGGCEFVLAEF